MDCHVPKTWVGHVVHVTNNVWYGIGRIKFIQKKFIEEFQNNKYRVIHMCSKSLHVFLLGFLNAIIDGLG